MGKKESAQVPHAQPLSPARHYIVGFFDLVGIGRELCELATFLEVKQEEIDRLGQLARRVMRFRDDFEKFGEGEQRISQEFDEPCSDEERAWRTWHRGNPVKIFTFSDTVVAYSSLDITERHVPLESCSNILMKAAASQLFSLVRKTPVRGAIEIGLGIEISDMEVFGTGIYEAYRLERDVADWPRILVGKRLQKYIVDVANSACNCDSDDSNQVHAKLCLDLLRFDHDDVAMVDLLSPSFAAIAGDCYPEWLTKAKTFAAAELERFTKEGDSKLMARYTKLSAYLCDDRE